MERRRPPNPEKRALNYLRDLLDSTEEMGQPYSFTSFDALQQHRQRWDSLERFAQRSAAIIAVIIIRNPDVREKLQAEIDKIKPPPGRMNHATLAEEMITSAEKAALEFALQKIAERRNKL